MRLPVEQMSVASVCRGLASTEAEFPPSRSPAEGSTEGVSNEVELVRYSRVGLLPSSEVEMERAV